MGNQDKIGIKRRLKGLIMKNMHRMITCKEFESFILGYLDGDLPAPQRSIFELHMRLCRECRDYLTAYRRTQELSQAALGRGDEPVPEDVPEDLIKAILEAREY